MNLQGMHKAKCGSKGLHGEKFTKKKTYWRETFAGCVSSIWVQPIFGLDWDGKRLEEKTPR